MILIVDDDAETRGLIATFLGQHSFTTATAGGAAEARAALAQRPALIVLDVMMPGEDGLSLLRTLDPATRSPVIIHSALGDDVDRIVGLEVGADDYVAKPCNPRELLARIRAILRRSGAAAATSSARLYFGGFKLDPEARLLDGPDGAIALTDGEFRLLLAFAEAPRRVLTRDHLIERVGGAEAEQFDRAIDVALSRLRKKLGDDGALIRTVRGEGYMLTAEVRRG